MSKRFEAWVYHGVWNNVIDLSCRFLFSKNSFCNSTARSFRFNLWFGKYCCFHLVSFHKYILEVRIRMKGIRSIFVLSQLDICAVPKKKDYLRKYSTYHRLPVTDHWMRVRSLSCLELQNEGGVGGTNLYYWTIDSLKFRVWREMNIMPNSTPSILFLVLISVHGCEPIRCTV